MSLEPGHFKFFTRACGSGGDCQLGSPGFDPVMSAVCVWSEMRHPYILNRVRRNLVKVARDEKRQQNDEIHEKKTKKW